MQCDGEVLNMKVAFPYMGCVTAYDWFLEHLGHKVVMPPEPTQRTIDLGVKYAPEFFCYPFKIMLGTYIEVAEKGAELFISSGGCGPCRAGLYGEVHQRVLDHLGFNTEVVIFDSLFQDPKDFFRKVLSVKNNTSLMSVLKYFSIGFKMVEDMDAIQRKINILRAYEINRGDFNEAFSKIKKMYRKCESKKDVLKTTVEANAMLDKIPIRKVREEERIRVGIVGEIYVIMERCANNSIEEKLNNLGVEVETVQDISSWVKHNLIPRRFNKEKSWQVIEKAKREYTPLNVGGHDLENMGWMIDFAERGFDGIVHCMPFGCLPELVTRSIIPQISKDKNIPILSLSFDEQISSANVQTRLEAFIDLAKNKKKKPGLFEEFEFKEAAIV